MPELTSFRATVPARNAMLQAIARLLAGGTIQLCSLEAPARPDDAAPRGTVVLAECLLDTPAFNPPENGTMTARTIGEDPEAPGGEDDATWFRAVSKDGTVIVDGPVRKRAKDQLSSGSALELDAVTVVPGARVRLRGWMLRHP